MDTSTIIDKRTQLLKWKISKQNLEEWSRLNKTIPKDKAIDCMINTMSILGILNRDIAEKLSIKQTTEPIFTKNELLFEKMQEYFINQTDMKYQFTSIKAYSMESIKLILDKLRPNEYTIAQFVTQNQSAHMVIITNDGNYLRVFDPQQEVMHCEDTDLIHWIRNNAFIDMYLYFSTKKTYIRPNITMRKSQNEERGTKRRRLTDLGTYVSIAHQPEPIEIKEINPRNKTLNITSKKKMATRKMAISRNKTARIKLINRLRLGAPK